MGLQQVLRPGDTCWRIEIADRCAVLIDGEAYFRAFKTAALAARNSILIVGRLEHLSQRLGRRGRMSVAVARLLPVAPFPLVNLVAGTARIRLPDYLLGSALGLAPFRSRGDGR